MEFQELLPRRLQFMEALTAMVLFMHLPRHSVAQLRSELGVTTLMSLLRPNGLHMEFLGNCPSCLQLLEVLTSTVLFMHLPRHNVAQLRSELGVTTLMLLLRPSGLHMEFLGDCLCCPQLLVLCGHFPDHLEALDIYGRVAIRGAPVTELTICILAEGPAGAVIRSHHGMVGASSHLDNLFEALDLYGPVAIRGAPITELTILIPAEGPNGAVLLPHHVMADAGSHLDNLFEALDLYGPVVIRGAPITELTIHIAAEGPDGAVLLPHHGMFVARSHLDNLTEALCARFC